MGNMVSAPYPHSPASGYLNAQSRQEEQRYRQAQIAQMMFRKFMEADERQRRLTAQEHAGNAFPMLGRGGPSLPAPPPSMAPGDGPQPPAPGQSSEPAAPPMPMGPPGSIPPPPAAAPTASSPFASPSTVWGPLMGQPPRVDETRPTVPAALQRMVEMDRQGVQGSVTAPGSPGAPVEPYWPLPPPGSSPAAPPAAAAPPMIGAPPAAAANQPPALSLEAAAAALQARGVSGGDLWRALNEMAPTMNAQFGMQLKLLNQEVSALRAQAAVGRVGVAQQEADRRKVQGDTRLGIHQQNADTNAARVAAGGSGGGQENYTPETIARMAQRIRSGDGDVWKEIGYTRGALATRRMVQEEVARQAKEAGEDVGAQLANKADYKALQRSLGDRQKFVSAVNQFINNFDSQIELVKKLAPKGTAGGVPVINKWVQAGRTALAGDPDVSAFDTAIRGLSREHQRIVTGVTSNAQLHVAAQQTADELLNRAMTEEQLASVLQVMKEEAENARKAGEAEVGALRGRIQQLGKGGGGAAPSPAPGAVQTFATEAAASAAEAAGTLKKGAKVKIGNQTGTWQ